MMKTQIFKGKSRENSLFKARTGMILVFMVLCMGVISAWSNNTFNNSLTSENLTFELINCYQETTNQSTAGDGNCGLSYTGSYSYSGIWITTGYTNDGNWTSRDLLDIGVSLFTANYTKPIGALITSVLQFTTNDANLSSTIPEICFNKSTIEIREFINIPYGAATYKLQCNNGTGFIDFYNLGESSWGITEEAMNWSIFQPVTRFLSVPINTILTNAYLNLSGYSGVIVDKESSANCLGGTFLYPNVCSNAFDENWDSYAVPTKAGDGSIIEENMTMFSNSANWTFKYQGQSSGIYLSNLTVYCKNDTSGLFLQLYNIVTPAAGIDPTHNVTIVIPDSCLISNPLTMRTLLNNTQGSCGENCAKPIYYEGSVKWFSFPNNTNLFIKNTNVWNFTDNFNKTNNRTNNFANIINNYLIPTYLFNDTYLIPFSFGSYTTGMLQYSDLLFNNIGFFENSQTFNSTTYETSLELFSLNLTYDQNFYPLSSANLIYNGTNYVGTKTISGNNVIFSSSFNIPLISGTQQNRSFYWDISLTNSLGTSHFNSSSKNQTVNVISLGDCSGTTNTKSLNITGWFEQTLLRFNPFDLKGTLTYSNSLGELSKNYSFTNLSIAEKSICINANTTFYLNGFLEYSNTSYVTKKYYFLDYPVSNVTKNINLFLLPSTSSTSFIIQVQDQDAFPLKDYYVSIFRYNAGNATPYLVQTLKTDVNGQGTAFLETEIVEYLFQVYDTNGTLVKAIDHQTAIPQATPYTITITVGDLLPSPLSYLANLTGLTYSLSFDKNTYLVTYTYSDTNTSFTSATLNVYSQNASGSPTLICYQNKSTSSGVFICDLTGNETGNYYAIGYIYRNGLPSSNRINFEIDTFSTTAGMLGIFGGFLIILICSTLFLYNELAGVWAVVLGCTFINLIGFIHFGIVYLSAIFAIAIILSIVLERG